jgi:heat shock protein HtpX
LFAAAVRQASGRTSQVSNGEGASLQRLFGTIKEGFTVMMRIALFLATNLGIILVLSVSLRLLGVDRILDEQGVGLDLTSLLIFAAVFGMGGAFISLAISKWMAKRSTGARVITHPKTQLEAWLVQTVERQAKEAGIGRPEVAIYEAPDINAFATGMNRNDALVAVSTGLLNNMSQDEAEAVLAHEVAHVANGDMVTLALVQGVVNTFVMFASRVIGHLVDRLVFKVERGHGPAFWITMIAAELVLGVLASMVVMWFSRFREFKADQGGAELAGKRKMLSALKRLQANNGQPAELPDQLAAFGISGGAARGIRKLLMSHPPLEERIAALQGSRTGRS